MPRKKTEVETSVEAPKVNDVVEAPAEEIKEAPKKKKKASKAKEITPVTEKAASEVTQEDLDKIFDDNQRKTLVASKNERKKLYKDDEDIVPLEGYDLVTPETERKEEFRILMNAAAPGAPRILGGKIIGFEETENDHVTLVKVKLKDTNGRFQIYIPLQEFMLYDKMKDRSPEGRRQLQSVLIRRFNEEIEFIPLAVNEKTGICYASRLRAMSHRAEQNFFRNGANGKPVYRVGRKVQGIITVVKAKWISVYFAGVDVTVPIEDITDNLSLNLRNIYKKGQIVTLKIKDIEVQKVELSSGSADKKIIVRLPKVKASLVTNDVWDAYKEGGIYTGIITFIVTNNAAGDNGNCFVSIDGQIDCHCPRPNNYLPEVGMEVAVKITQKFEKDRRLNGTIIN